MELLELKTQFEELKQKSADLKGFMELDAKKCRREEIEAALADSAIWNNPKKSAELLKEKKIF